MFGKRENERRPEPSKPSQRLNLSENNSNLNSNIPKFHKIIPYAERLKNYLEKRKQIFENNKISLNKKLKRSSERIKNFYKNKLVYKKRICSLLSSIHSKPNDLRPYAEIYLGGEKYLALLDSGAEISCLGGKLALKMCENSNFKKSATTVQTADGKKQVASYFSK